jgi:hypothetical protein
MPADVQLVVVLAKLSEMQAKIGELHGMLMAQNAMLGEMKVNMGINTTLIGDTLKKTIHDEVAAGTAAVKEKKKTATGESKAGEEKKSGPAKKSHPSLPDVTEAAWELKKTGDDFTKRLDWFVSVLSKHPAHMHALIGADEVKRIESTERYKGLIGMAKKQGDREKAKAFMNALKQLRTEEGTFDALSKKLVADYETQLQILNSQKIGQLGSETQTASEAAAAAAMASLNLGGAPVTIHTSTATTTGTVPVTVTAEATTTATTATTTATPAAQLSAV